MQERLGAANTEIYLLRSQVTGPGGAQETAQETAQGTTQGTGPLKQHVT
jgi:hypothetical protein